MKYFKSRPLTDFVQKITTPLFRQRGFAEAKILSDWPKIVGAELARHTTPTKLSFTQGQTLGATLHVQVSNGGMAIEIQHQENIILEKIATYFGYRAVNKLALLQAPIAQKSESAFFKKHIPQGELSADDHALIDTIEDESLKAALTSLGKHVKAK